MKLKEVIQILEEIAPPQYAEGHDPIGLHVGDPEQTVRQIMVTLDATPAVVAEAIKEGIDLIVAHHPLIYTPLTSVRTDVYPQSIVYQLVKAGIALFAMHTNFDAAEGGINDVLAEKLGVAVEGIIDPIYSSKMYKLVTFAPEGAVGPIREAIFDAGAGTIGKYTECSFQSPGTGTFKPMDGAQPFLGSIGEFEQTPEIRLEMVVPQSDLQAAISALVKAHPYEEPAYDVYPLENTAKVAGLGLYGHLRNPMTFEGFCEMVQDVLDVDDLRVSGDPEATVHKVGLLGGGGGRWLEKAHAKGVDVYVTGDVNHHQFLHAEALGLMIVDATHFHTERWGMIALTPRLQDLVTSDGVVVQYADDKTLNLK